MFASPTGHTDIIAGGQPSIEAVMYFERKAIGGAAAVATGEINVDPDERNLSSWPRDLLKRNNYNFPRLANAVSRHGAVPSAELQFTGAKSRYRGREPRRTDPAWGPVDMDDYMGYKVRAMTDERLAEVIHGFGESALAAKNHGFEMVTLHGGHGWGLQQFMSPSMNTRTDRWGGSTENRCRLAVMAIDEIHRVCGSGFPVEIRISGSEIEPNGYGVEEACRIAEQLDGHADIIHVSVGHVFNSDQSFFRTHVSMFYPEGINVQYAAEIKKHVKYAAVGTVGGLSTPEFMEEILASGQADIIYMARELLCDPDFPNKLRHGDTVHIRKCMRCLNCFSQCMLKGDFHCAINPEISRERETFYSLPPANREKVLVIGGGIAGMEAALIARQNGHDVVLCEKSGELGGLILCERDVPFKKRLHEYIEQQARLIREAGVEIRLNTEVTPEYAKAEGADAIIAAIGSVPSIPNIPGVDRNNVVHAIELFRHPDRCGNKLVILGAGFVGTELAIFLKKYYGLNCEIVEMRGSISDGGNDHHKMAVDDQLKQLSIPVHFHTKAVEITAEGVRCVCGENEVFYGGDTVALAAGMQARSADAALFNDCSPSFHLVGECRRVANILEATATAYTTARFLGRFSD
jgi:2,4-dienoyl-CoA reductase-like NADH-dependent reductase (Old Yellow Enzyme family)/thioredoxin reductase